MRLILMGGLGAVLASGCGRTVPIPEDDTGGSTTGPTTTGPNPTTTGPNPSTTSTTTTTGGCVPDCEPEYVCVDGECVWEPCQWDPYCCGEPCCAVEDPAGDTKLRCRPEPDCYDDVDCPEGSFCADYYYCQPVEELPECAGFTSGFGFAAPDTVALAGLNANGNPLMDLAAGRIDGLVDVRIGDTLNVISSFDVMANITDVVAGDFDGNGRDDLAVGGSNGSVTILLGNGGGGFTQQPGFFQDGAASHLAAADINADGTDDVVVGSDIGSINAYLMKGGSIGDVWQGWAEGPVFGVAAGEVAPDFGLEVMVMAEYQGGPGMLHGPGLGGYDVWYDGMMVNDRRILVPDLGGDGQGDPVTVHEANGWTMVALFVGGATYPDVVGFPGRYGSDADVLDANGDGRDDVVVGGADGVAVLFGQPGGLSCGAVRPLEPARHVAGVDVDGDGSDDVAYAAPGAIAVLYAN